MKALTDGQIASMGELQKACGLLSVEAVLIGAMALRIGLGDLSRHTEDVDLAVAIDLDEFPQLTTLLQQDGWIQHPRQEHRWHTPTGARLDLIPAGAKLRRARHFEWPVSQMRMSLAGFEHVFSDAVEFQIGADFRFKVVTLAVLTLMKMAAYMDNPYERQKDVQDVAVILARYQPEDSRRFSDDVVEAQLDYEAVGAYCIGQDLRGLCSLEEISLVEHFIAQVKDEDNNAFHLFGRQVASTVDNDPSPQVAMLTMAFELGFGSKR